MRAVLTSSGLIVSIMLIIFIHLTVISDNVIENETSNSLDSAMDYAYDKMMDNYEDINFVEYYKSSCYVWFDNDGYIEYISKDNNYNGTSGIYYETGEEVLTDDLMKRFCAVLQSRIKSSNSKITTQLIYRDFDTGTMQIRVIEEYTTPAHVTKSCYFEKTYSLI